VDLNKGDALLNRIAAVDTSKAAWRLNTVWRMRKHVDENMPNHTVELLERLLVSALERDNTKRITLHEFVFHPWVTFNGSLPLLGPTAMRVLPPPWLLPDSPRPHFDQHWASVLTRIQSFLQLNPTRGSKRSMLKQYTKVKEVYLQQVWRSFLTAEEERFLHKFLFPELEGDFDPPHPITPIIHPSSSSMHVKGFIVDAEAKRFGFKEGWLDSDVCLLCDRVFSTSTIFAQNPKMFCRFCGRAVCKHCSTHRMHHPMATFKQRACNHCKDAEARGDGYFKHGLQYEALHDCVDVAAAEGDVRGIFFVGFDHALCQINATAHMRNLRKRKEDPRAVGKRDLVDWFGGSTRLAALKQLIAKDLPRLGVVTVVLGTGAVEDMQIVMKRVGLLPASRPACQRRVGRPRASSLIEILQTHGVAEVCGAPVMSTEKLTSFQMQKYISECYLRLIGRPIMQRNADMKCFLADFQCCKINQTQVGFDIPSDQKIRTKVSKGLKNSDMKCVLDFFKRRNSKLLCSSPLNELNATK